MGEIIESGITAPQPLNTDHDVLNFNCGEQSLDYWLQRRALFNQTSGASRTYVVCVGRRVIGFYALAVGGVAHRDSPGKLKRNMPDLIPVMILGRLAIDREFQAKGLGSALLRDAILRILQAAKIAGIRAILVHAISEPARKFYERRGFRASPMNSMTLMITLGEAAKELLSEGEK